MEHDTCNDRLTTTLVSYYFQSYLYDWCRRHKKLINHMKHISETRPVQIHEVLGEFMPNKRRPVCLFVRAFHRISNLHPFPLSGLSDWTGVWYGCLPCRDLYDLDHNHIYMFYTSPDEPGETVLLSKGLDWLNNIFTFTTMFLYIRCYCRQVEYHHYLVGDFIPSQEHLTRFKFLASIPFTCHEIVSH